jgi:hypothetical protein
MAKKLAYKDCSDKRMYGDRTLKWCPLIWAVVWQLVRLPICAVLAILEPILAVILVPLALLSFCVTILFGFMFDAPNFPKWGMLAFSIAPLLLYWLFLGFMSLFMGLPSDRN